MVRHWSSFHSPQPNTSRSRKTTDTGSVHRVVCPFTPQLFGGTHLPTPEGWHAELALVHSSRWWDLNPRPRDRKSGTVPLGHRVPNQNWSEQLNFISTRFYLIMCFTQHVFALLSLQWSYNFCDCDAAELEKIFELHICLRFLFCVSSGCVHQSFVVSVCLSFCQFFWRIAPKALEILQNVGIYVKASWVITGFYFK